MKKILELHSLTKKYSGIVALDGVSLSFVSGQIHSIVGENGAGKSTLIQMITGASAPNHGTIVFDGETIEHMTPLVSQKLKIYAVYQELNLIPELTVYQNIFYGRELKKGLFLDRKEMKKRASEILKSLHSNLDVETPVKHLGMGSRQVVEIAKALVDEPRLILLDEPTSSLPIKEAEHLHEIMKRLAEKGIAVIFVSHKLDEVLKISDTISVLRDGHLISTKHRQKGSWNGVYSISTLVKDMLGKSVIQGMQEESARKEERGENAPGEESESPILELRDVSTQNIHHISFSLKRGEILSLSGMLGSMRTEVLSAIFGMERLVGGGIYINGVKKEMRSPQDAIQSDIGFVTEDRKDSGLYMNLSIRENMRIAYLKNTGSLSYVKNTFLDRRIEEILNKLSVKHSSLDQKVKELSGGNQQKIAIGKWLMSSPSIILLDEPTRGVDVGAKEEIYRIIFDLAGEGKAILMVSSEMEEILRLSHRTFVMNQGKIVSSFGRERMNVEEILKDAANFNV